MGPGSATRQALSTSLGLSFPKCKMLFAHQVLGGLNGILHFYLP